MQLYTTCVIINFSDGNTVSVVCLLDLISAGFTDEGGCLMGVLTDVSISNSNGEATEPLAPISITY